MGEFFSNIYGAQFPDVVFNSGPLPSAGGLPAPLHDTADARINYGSTLLGDLSPYAYGEPGYQSSQSAFLNIPHRVQKIVPVLHLPEAKRATSGETFELSHPVDDSDVAFVLRLNRNSLFCTGLKNATFSRMGLSTQVDPLVNLCTLNYLLSGIQLGIADQAGSNLWYELLNNMDPKRFEPTRNLTANPIDLSDLQHVVRHCVRPLGIVRGSEKQGGQNEVTQSPATWPVCFVTTLVLDGKEANTLNLWHHHGISAGDDLVLCLKPMPLKPYTLNHYYKRVVRQRWSTTQTHVWQLVPTTFHLDEEDEHPITEANWQATTPFWQERGYWHIGRAQVMAPKYGLGEYYADDMANQLKTHHLDMTFQPMFCKVKGGPPTNRPGVVRGVLTARPPAPPRALLFDRLASGPPMPYHMDLDWLPTVPTLDSRPTPRALDSFAPPTSSALDSLALPTRSTLDSLALPTSSALDSLALPTRSTLDSLALPTRSTLDSLALPTRSTLDSLALPTTSTLEDLSLPATSTLDDLALGGSLAPAPSLGKRAAEAATDKKRVKRAPANSLEGTLLRPDGTQEGGVSMAML